MLWFSRENQAKNGAKNEHFCPVFFALSTDDMGYLEDEKRKTEGKRYRNTVLFFSGIKVCWIV